MASWLHSLVKSLCSLTFASLLLNFSDAISNWLRATSFVIHLYTAVSKKVVIVDSRYWNRKEIWVQSH